MIRKIIVFIATFLGCNLITRAIFENVGIAAISALIISVALSTKPKHK